MKKIRAIFIGDLRFDECPIFELNAKTDYYEMITNTDFKYSKECIEQFGSDFLIFEIENDEAKLIMNNVR